MVEREDFWEEKVSLDENLGKKLIMATFAVEPGYWGTDKGPTQFFRPPVYGYMIFADFFQGPLFSVHRASLAHLLLQYVG